MSWYEYSDMFDKAQENGKYRCHVFDIKNSKSGYDVSKLYKLIELLKEKIDKSELHTTEQYKSIPCVVSGDIVLILTYRNGISDEELYKIFKEAKEESGLGKDFHYLSGYYETDDWVEGDLKYYLGYCIQELEYRSKRSEKII